MIAFFFLFSFIFTNGMILVFPGGSDVEFSKFEIGQTKWWWTKIYSQSDVPFGNDQPYVGYEFWITRDSVESKGHLDILVYDSESGKYVGGFFQDNNAIEYCCTSGDCRGKAYFRNDPGVKAIEVLFEEGNTTAYVQGRVPVEKTGDYILQISNCLGNWLGVVEIRGSAVWRNPYGYLRGDVFMGLYANGFLTLCNLLVLAIFGFLCIKYRHLLMILQYGILGVLVYNVLESAAWWFYHIGLNNIGLYNIAALLVLVFLANVKKTVARVLVLLVSMGMGTVKWTLGTARMKLAYLSVLYLFFFFLLQIIKELETLEMKEIVSSVVRFLVVIPAAILETLFYFWIILSLIRTTQQLTLRRQVLKLQMYKIFFGILIIIGILAFTVILCQIIYKSMEKEIPWQWLWALDAVTDFFIFFVVWSIAFLWRPRMNNTSYGYAEFFSDQEGSPQEDKQIPMETIVINGELTHRKKVDNKPEKKEERNLNLSDFEKNLLSINIPAENDDEVSLETEVNKID